ncbi:nuclease, putative [Ricinus communis]|uniref:Nuclease, putative n=1 Tax=Ricinus communis TaxID=3988 RepID=B9RQ71_RICCO|nr:nuclease, putative [Ricinus communis]
MAVTWCWAATRLRVFVWLGGLLQRRAGLLLILMGRVCNALEAELWAVIKGPKLAWDKEYRRENLAVDSLLVAEWLAKDSEVCDEFHSNLVFICRRLLNQAWHVNVKHVYRECDMAAADFLANLTMNQARGVVLWCAPPAGIEPFLQMDAASVRWSLRIAVRTETAVS